MSYKDENYYRKFPKEWIFFLKDELAKDFPFLKGSGRWKWFMKYVLRLIKTPNAYKHPMEKPAYSFQKHMKLLAEKTDTSFMEP